MKKYFSHLGADLPAGLVVFLVAIPLCLGIALGSEVPPFSGLIAGVIGGIVVGCVSNSRIGVSGPAAGLIAIIIAAMTTFKSELSAEGIPAENINLMALQMLGLAVLISGIIQFILGIAKAGINAQLKSKCSVELPPVCHSIRRLLHQWQCTRKSTKTASPSATGIVKSWCRFAPRWACDRDTAKPQGRANDECLSRFDALALPD